MLSQKNIDIMPILFQKSKIALKTSKYIPQKKRKNNAKKPKQIIQKRQVSRETRKQHQIWRKKPKKAKDSVKKI